MKPNRGLGKGLSALFSETEEDYGKSLLFDEEPKAKGEGVTEVDISSVFANPNQPRKVFDETALKELAASIAKHGVIMPIIVNKSGDRYMIIAGERRFRASKIAGLTKVPVIIKTYNERQIKEISLIENLQREDLNPIEAATAMRSLMDDYGMTQEELADRIGKSRPAIANTLRLLTLSQEVIKLVANGYLSAGHARALVSVPQFDQVKIAEDAIKDGLSVRDIEKKVKDYFAPPEEKAKKKIKQELSAELKELIVDMQRVFGTRVNAIGNDKKGRIYIDYYTRDDLDRLSELLEFLKNSKK
ncbi:MAG: ParB/RepB/Spo0J family partition protein [Clostridia bacterium]|nr:ParB/RepB/Spo0J family partition protein [Clostridia bacterium]MBR2449752.1 ParB/RepB/Spo0J family partition protein [Clostridia bacterium]